MEELKEAQVYVNSDKNKKAMITNNWNLINSAGIDKIHFNIKKLEEVIGYTRDDKNTLNIWDLLTLPDFIVKDNLFPENLKKFLGLEKNDQQKINEDDDLPF